MNKECAVLLVAASLLLPPPPPATAQSKTQTPPVQFVQSASGVAYKDGVLTLKMPRP
jgi:hypothetical protein